MYMLPVAALLTVLTSISISCTIAVSSGDWRLISFRPLPRQFVDAANRTHLWGLMTSFAWAGHVPPWPQISMCGMYAPEKYVFSIGMTVGAGLLAILLVINHFRNERFNPMRSTAVAGGCLCVCVSLCAR